MKETDGIRKDQMRPLAWRSMMLLGASCLVIFSTPGKFVTKFNVLRCVSLNETLFGQGPGVEYQSP